MHDFLQRVDRRRFPLIARGAVEIGPTLAHDAGEPGTSSPQGEHEDAYRDVCTTACLALVGTIVCAQSVTYDFDRSANFTRFKTYTWVRGTNLNDELNHKRIMQAVDARLTARGFSKVDATGNPDVLVAYHASFDRDLEIFRNYPPASR